MHSPACPPPATGNERSGAAAFGMPLPLAPLTATSDAEPTSLSSCGMSLVRVLSLYEVGKVWFLPVVAMVTLAWGRWG